MLVFTSISCRAVILGSLIHESRNLCFTLSASSSMLLTHSVGRLFVPACIMMCDGEPEKNKIFVRLPIVFNVATTFI